MPQQTHFQDWSALAEKLWVAQFVPEAHAAYRPLITEGLRFFLERLPPWRLSQILGEQLELPHDVSPARRLIALLRHCPTLHKLGQTVARDRRLSSELRENLQHLESLPPTTSLEAIKTIIQQEWGQVASLEIGSEALAEASVAVVVPFVWRDPRVATPRPGVFKVLRPGVEEQLQEELAIWSALGPFLEERCAVHGLPALDYRHTLDSVRRLLAHEIQLDREQVHLARAAAFHADSRRVFIPALLPFCTARMTAMERVEGWKVTNPGPSSIGSRRLAETLIEALIAKPFWSNPQADAYFHADPHAGNLFLTRDGRLAILDWALVTSLSKAQRVAVVQTVINALTQNEVGVAQAIANLGHCSDPAALRNAVAAGLHQVRLGTFPGMEWLMALLDRLGTTGVMRFSEELTLFRKAMLTLSGVIQDVSKSSPIDTVLMQTGLQQYFRELPARQLAPYDSRAFGSHLSNADGFDLLAGFPMAFFRYWIGAWQDTLDAKSL